MPPNNTRSQVIAGSFWTQGGEDDREIGLPGSIIIAGIGERLGKRPPVPDDDVRDR